MTGFNEAKAVPSSSAFLWLFSQVTGPVLPSVASGTEVCRDECSSVDTDMGIPFHPKSELNNRVLINYSKEVDITWLSLLINIVGNSGQQKELII